MYCENEQCNYNCGFEMIVKIPNKSFTKSTKKYFLNEDTRKCDKNYFLK